MLDFLLQNISVKRTPMEWCELLNVHIIDWDGWATLGTIEQPCPLDEFVERVSRCTIENPKPQREVSLTFRPGDDPRSVEITLDHRGLTAEEVAVVESREDKSDIKLPVFAALAHSLSVLIRQTYMERV